MFHLSFWFQNGVKVHLLNKPNVVVFWCWDKLVNLNLISGTKKNPNYKINISTIFKNKKEVQELTLYLNANLPVKIKES